MSRTTRSKETDGGWTKRASRLIFESNWFRLREDELTLPSGEDITYTVVEQDGWALVVPLCADGRIVMAHVFRHTLQRIALECPAGAFDGDPPIVAAHRELEEETGYVAEAMVHLGRFATTSGISSERFDAFVALDPQPTGRRQLEATEQIEVELIHIDELERMAIAGEIPDAPTTMALLMTAARLRAGDLSPSSAARPVDEDR